MFQDGSVGRSFSLKFGKKRTLRTLPVEKANDHIVCKLAEGETQDINLQPIALCPAETVHRGTEFKENQTTVEYA